MALWRIHNLTKKGGAFSSCLDHKKFNSEGKQTVEMGSAQSVAVSAQKDNVQFDKQNFQFCPELFLFTWIHWKTIVLFFSVVQTLTIAV